MDGRDAVAMSGGPYYLHTGMGGSTACSQQPGLHHGTPTPPVIRSIPNPGVNLPVPSSGIGSVAFHVESLTAVSYHAAAASSGGLGGGMNQGEQAVKRKRGRPRKYGPDGNMSLALSPLSSSCPASAPGMVSGSTSRSSTSGQKRGRGRPPGTGRKQQLASLGEWIAGSAGMGFTPHVISIAVGEDIATKIMSFSQQGPRSVCILSANGVVSTVTLRQPDISGGTVTYEGRFEILCLSGSYILTDNGGSRSRSGGLSISLSSPDGWVIGGSVGGLLRAATPVQVVVGSFIYAESRKKNKNKTGQESGAEFEQKTGDKPSASSSSLPNQSLTPSPVMGVWPGSRQLVIKNSHIDIDLTCG